MPVGKKLLLLTLLLFSACASGPGPPTPGKATVWGHVQLVPPPGVPHPKMSSASYGDRRFKDVESVDYGEVGFVVVYVDSPCEANGKVALGIRDSRFGLRIDPDRAAISVGGTLVVANDTEAPHVVSCPAADVLSELSPGSSIEIPVESAGGVRIFVLDVPGVEASVFVAPGSFSVASPSGRFELEDLPPGPIHIRAWHPRFPPDSLEIETSPNEIREVDLSITLQNLPKPGES